MIARTLIAACILLLTACANSRPAEIAFDSDTCVRCHMQISDRHYAAAVVTRKGRTLKFDSIDCLRAYLADANAKADAESIWVADFAHPGVMLAVEKARFADVVAARSPMGKTHGWAAFASASDAFGVGADTVNLRDWSTLP